MAISLLRSTVGKWELESETGKVIAGSKEKNVPLWGWLSIGTGAQRNYGISILQGFQNSTGQSPEQPYLNVVLTLFWARCWTGHLLRFLAAERICNSVVCGIYMVQKPQETLAVLERWIEVHEKPKGMSDGFMSLCLGKWNPAWISKWPGDTSIFPSQLKYMQRSMCLPLLFQSLFSCFIISELISGEFIITAFWPDGKTFLAIPNK